MSQEFKPNYTVEQLKDAFKKVEIAERRSKTLIKKAAYDVLYYAHTDGNTNPVNDLVPLLTPANRLAVVQLLQHCTLFQWKAKDCKFGGKQEFDTKAEKDAAQEIKNGAVHEFLHTFGGDIWQWYEAKKAKENETPKFNAASFERMIKIYAANNDNSFDGLDEIITKAKSNALNELELKPVIAAKIKEFEAMGFSKAKAEKLTQELLADGKLKANPKAKAKPAKAA